MKFSNPKQVIAILVCWAATLFAVDYYKNPAALASYFGAGARLPPAVSATPRLTLLMNHMCCSGCLSDVRDALSGLPWLGPVQLAQPGIPSQEEADGREGAVSYANQIAMDILDVSAVDFVAVDNAVRGTGLAIERMELSGLSHFRLVADVKHICCQLCSRAVDEGFAIAMSLRATGQFAWLDSVVVNKEKHEVTAFARYDNTADITELLGALSHIGFSASAVHVKEGDGL